MSCSRVVDGWDTNWRKWIWNRGYSKFDFATLTYKFDNLEEEIDGNCLFGALSTC